MILESIILDNIRTYKHEEIEFGRGITVFYGDTGSGKSSILMGIEFALFGLSRSEIPGASLLSAGEASGYVELSFTSGPRKCRVKRALRRRADRVDQDAKGTFLEVDGTREPLTASDLKKRILEILRFNEPESTNTSSRIFRYAIFTPQDEMKAVLSGSGDRLDTIRRAFGMEEYALVEENASGVRTDLKNRALSLSGMFARLDDEALKLDAERKKLPELREQLRQIRAENEMCLAKLRDLEARLGAARENDKMRVKLAETRVGLERDAARLEGEIGRARSDMERTRSEAQKYMAACGEMPPAPELTRQRAADDLARYEKTASDIAVARSRLDSSSRRMEDLLRGMPDPVPKTESIQSSIGDARARVGELEARMDENSADYEEALKRTQTLETKREVASDELASIKKLGNKCPRCMQEITAERRSLLTGQRGAEIRRLEESIKISRDEAFDLAKAKANIKSSLGECRRNLEDLERTRHLAKEYWGEADARSGLEQALDLLRSDFTREYDDPLPYLKGLVRRHEEYDRALDAFENAKRNLDGAQARLDAYSLDVATREQQLAGVNGSLASVIREMDAIPDFDAKGLESEQNALEQGLRAASNRMGSLDTDIRTCERTISDLERSVSEMAGQKRLHSSYMDCVDWLGDFFIPAVRQIEKQVLISILLRFRDRYAAWFAELVDDPDKESDINERFAPVATQGGYEISVDSLSGGERTSVALAYRLALNTLMREDESLLYTLLILDEPTTGFSQNQINKVTGILRRLDSEQIIIVSHARELESVADGMFYVSKRSGASHVARNA